jgi:chromosome segregation ATPase
MTAVVQQINGLKDTIETQSNALRDRKRKFHALSQNLNALETEFENLSEESQSQIAHLNNTIASLHNQNEDLTAANLSLKKDLQNNQHQYQELQQSWDAKVLQLSESHKSELRESQHARDSLEAQHREELAQQRQQYTETAEALSAEIKANLALQKKLASQKAANSEKLNELKVARAVAEEQQQVLAQRLDFMKKQLSEAHERVLSELRAQLDEQRSDFKKLTVELATTERRLKDAKAQIFELRKEILKREKEAESREDQTSREKKLREAASQAAILAAESKYTAKLNEQREIWETEKRKILTFVADAFKQFLGGRDVVDERAVRQVINKTKGELAILTEMDAGIRRIVGAAAGQRR